ncbi:SLBB domain-containing protein [Lacihabitans soyangensis]|uniref:Sugar transporter n=1 Tax=Lacihabitans soyangensis TaxID=869394 RepID=A0AAE3H1G0_9BACT|nr:SLBB domain-containing protein [Lacihabitans soyangensis]MCP9762897.1 sugar transporter [Lacihabitans soyangensis]
MIQKIKKCFFVFLLLQASLTSYAQSVDELSDEDIQKFMQQAQESGMNEEQLAAAAAAKGFTASDIVKFKERIEKLKSSKKAVGIKSSLNQRTVDSTDIQASERDNKKQVIDEKAEDRRMKIFGLNIFNNQTLNFEPNLNIATPKNYVLGTNDELSIDITGYAYAHYDAKVNPDGNIKIENLNPIFVAGQTLEQAKVKIVQRLKTLFGGLGNGGLSADVTLSKIRSIKVTVIGEAVFPGTYTVPSLATAFNVLYAAGGPTDIGSLRNIEIFRKGKKVRMLDLYDFLLRGDLTDDIGLIDQDVVLIPYVDKRVIINGAVRNPKIYELKAGDNLGSLIGFAGGFGETAYSKSIRINRVTDTEMKILKVSKEEISKFGLLKGDIVIVDSLLNRYENRVSIKGAVFRPGDYELETGMTLKKLVAQAEGLKPEAFKSRALLFRERPNADPEILPLNLSELLNDTAEDIVLQKNDSLVIKTIAGTRELRTIQLDGEINKPSVIPYVENITVSDAILLAGGLKDGANVARIEVARRVKADGGDGDQNVQIIQIQVDPSLGILDKDKRTLLKPFDRVYVRKMSRYEVQRTVSITGEINYPGPYTLNDKKERISDLIEKAGGTKGQADLGSAKFTRNGVQMGIDLKKAFFDKNSNQNLLLNPGDVLEIPRRKETVTVLGQVYNPITVPFDQGLNLKDYISLAGGTTDSAYVKKIYVKYGNGKISRTKYFAGINSFPKIENGAEIYVPLHKKQRWTSAERIAVSSAVVSIATVLLTLVLRVVP